MLLTDNHFTAVVGIDIHATTAPPFNVFHPYLGIVMDIGDYIPFLGSDVYVNGSKRGNSDTGGILLTFVHIPLFSPWVLSPIIGHESMNFFASETVYSDSTRLSPKGFMVMVCNDVGLPLSAGVGGHKVKKFKITPTLFAPTAYSLPIPMGAPVNVGGPYSPDWGAAVMNLLMSIGFGALLRKAGKMITKANLDGKFPNWLSKGLCKLGFEPINLVNGAVLYEGIDFDLPSPVPLEWERRWYSDSDYEGWLGHGVHSKYDRAVELYPLQNAIGLRMEDGRLVAFPQLQPGEESYLRSEKVTLKRSLDGSYYTAYHHKERLYYHFTLKSLDGLKYQLTRIENDYNIGITFKYSNHKLVEIIDASGRLLKVYSTDRGYIDSLFLVTPEGKEEPLVSYRYDDLGNMVAIIDALGQSTTIVYQEHLMVEKTDRNGQSFYWEYDNLGRCIHTWGDGGLQEGWVEYHPEEGYNLVTDANGAVTTYYYTPEQLVTRITDPLGHSTDYRYTDHMELYREIDPEGHITGYTYDDFGNKTSVTYADNTQELFIYDQENRLSISVDAKGEQTVYVYDKEHIYDLKSIVEPDKTATHFEYNTYGLLQKIKKEEHVIELSYDNQYNLTSWQENGDRLKSWEYDYKGQVITEYTPKQMPHHFFYDRLGRIREIIQNTGNKIELSYNSYDEVIGVKDAHREVHLEYTALGSIRTREQNGVKVHFNYDKMEQLTGIYNEAGEHYYFARNKAGQIIKEVSFDGSVRKYRHSAGGLITRIEREEGRYTEYEHDALGRITRVEYHDGSWETYRYDKNGHLIEAVNEQVEVYLERDAKGRIIKEIQKPHLAPQEDAHIVISHYNELGQRIRVESSLGGVVETDYDQHGNVAKIQAASEQLKEQQKHWQAKLTHDLLGRELERFAQGGIHVKNRYDNYGNLQSKDVYSGKSRTGLRYYKWNTQQQLIKTQSHLSSNPTYFDYDSFGNLVHAEYSYDEYLFKTPDEIGNLYKSREQDDRVYGKGGKLLKDEKYHYKYDSEGNLILKSERNINEPLPRPKAKGWIDKLLTTAPKEEEQQAHGEWQLGDWRYEWYANGMLKSVTKPDGTEVIMEYDALGRRTAKIVNEEIHRYIWNGNILLHEWQYALEDRPRMQSDDVGRIHYSHKEPVPKLTTWVYEEGQFCPSAKIEGDKTYSIVNDYLGRPIQAYTEKGELIWDTEYDIYGQLRNFRGSKGFIPFRQLGQYEDIELGGLYYNRFRYYDSNTGLYLSKDPIGLLGNNPNLYAYVHDSNSWIDVFGLDCWRTARKKYWKTKYADEILNPTGKYSAKNLALMKQGNAPRIKVELSDTLGNKRIVDIPIELHHTKLPQRLGTSKANEVWNLTEVTPWGHASMDTYRKLGDNFKLERIINGTNSW